MQRQKDYAGLQQFWHEDSKEGVQATSAAHRADLCLDQQQCMVAQGVEGEEGGEVPTGHLLTHQLQCHATWPCTISNIMSDVTVLPNAHLLQHQDALANLNAVQSTGMLLRL